MIPFVGDSRCLDKEVGLVYNPEELINLQLRIEVTDMEFMKDENLLAYPTHFHITSGAGVSKHPLVAFDQALIRAEIANYNLLRVSSILPIGCKREEKMSLCQGALLPTAYATISSCEAGCQLATAVAVGIPARDGDVGVIMEYSGQCSEEEARETVCSMVREAMKNHEIPMKEILVSSIAGVVPSGECLSLISAIALW